MSGLRGVPFVGSLTVPTQYEVEQELAILGNGPRLHGTDDGTFHSGIMRAMEHDEPISTSDHVTVPPSECWEE